LAATFLEGVFGNLFDVLLLIGVALAIALTVIQVIGLEADALVNVILSLIPPPTELAGYALSAALLPATFLSSGLVSAAWAVANGSESDSTLFAPLLSVVGSGAAAIRLSTTVPEAINTVEYLSQTASGSLLAVYEPIVSVVTGLLSIALSLVGRLVSGPEATTLATLGVIIAAGGALFTGFVLARYLNQVKESGQLGEQVIGLGLDGVGIAASLAELGG